MEKSWKRMNSLFRSAYLAKQSNERWKGPDATRNQKSGDHY